MTWNAARDVERFGAKRRAGIQWDVKCDDKIIKKMENCCLHIAEKYIILQ